ncbi:MAG: GAF domain-containing protein [Oculatellaceae cyanobacterium Prado106]|jgi:signal transduction histidine kinase/PAS domain-containing protein|nr:GAF domain-containing protein [Oculatellaceae cyanobacterium Prado106]
MSLTPPRRQDVPPSPLAVSESVVPPLRLLNAQTLHGHLLQGQTVQSQSVQNQLVQNQPEQDQPEQDQPEQDQPEQSQSVQEPLLPGQLPTYAISSPLIPQIDAVSADLKGCQPDSMAHPGSWGALICFTLNPAGQIESVNLPGAATLGYGAADLAGLSFADLLHPYDRPSFLQKLADCSLEGFSVAQWQFRLLRQDGQAIPQFAIVQRLQGNPAENGQGSVLLICQGSLGMPAPAVLGCSPCQQQVEQVLRLQSEWKRLMQAIAIPVRRTQPLKQILKITASEIQQILQSDRVFIYHIQSGTTGSVTIEVLKDNCPGVRRKPQTAQVLQQKCRSLKSLDRVQATPSPNPSEDSPQWLQWMQDLGATAEIVVPILQQRDENWYASSFGLQEGLVPEPSGMRLHEISLDENQPILELWGLLVVHQVQGDRQWQPWELDLLDQLVTHLGIVVQQSELTQRTQRLNANLERQIRTRTSELQLAFDFEATLKRITDKVRDSLDVDQILQVALQEVARAIGVKGCNASLYDLERQTSTVHYEYTHTLSPYQGRVVRMDVSPEIYAQLLQGQAFQFCSLNPNQERGPVTMLTCPMTDDQGVLGDLWLINQANVSFSEQEIRLVQQVANQCAIAIRQARLFQAAQAQVLELERLNHLKDDFLSTVSHELRTPMTNIKLAIQMLEVMLKQAGLLVQEDQKISRYFKILQGECHREIGLINDLLDLSRLEAGSESLDYTSVDLFTWIPSITQAFVERTHSHQQQLHLNLALALPDLNTDLSHLERILSELLQNACKYTPAGERIIVSTWSNFGTGIHAELQCSSTGAEADCRPASISLSVCNSGVEIPPEELSRIFEKFYRIPNNDPWQHGGTGLGLALVKKLVEHLGGKIQAKSEQNRTCFTVELPMVELPRPELPIMELSNMELPTMEILGELGDRKL